MAQLTSFKIAKYILFLLVLVLCIWIIIYIFVSEDNESRTNSNEENIIRVNNNQSPCEKNITNNVSQMWAYNFESVPQKYINIMEEYLNEPITMRESGYCNDTKFTCKPGQLRKDCDPCALGSARQFALNQQIADEIAKECE